MNTVRNVYAVIGFVFTCLALFATFGIGELRICYGKPGQCQLASELKGAAK